MITCSFIGHKKIYDGLLYEKLLRTVNRIVQQDDEIDFLFSRNGAFYNLCLKAALHVKQRYPQKKITLTLVINESKSKTLIEPLRQGNTYIPLCVVDKIIAVSVQTQASNADNITDCKKIDYWIIQQSTHLISYIYPAFHYNTENQLYMYAQNRNLTILDITTAATARKIAKNINIALEPEKNVYQEDAQEQIPSPICGIFALGAAAEGSLASFEKAVSFLVDTYHVYHFYIAFEYCFSPYMNVLQKLAKMYKLHFTAITRYEPMPNEQWISLSAQFCPPCHSVKNIDTQVKRIEAKKSRTIKAIIDQSDFCICNLSGHPIEENLRRYIAKAKTAVSLDISKKHTEIQSAVIE